MELNTLFEKYGYRIYMCSIDQRYISFVQEENYYVNVIGFFDERRQTSTQAQMQSFLDVHKDRLTYGRPKDLHFLKLICTDALGVGRLEPGMDAHGLAEKEEAEREAQLTRAWTEDVWYLIDDKNPDTETGQPMGGRLFVPQSAPEDFYGLRQPLDRFVAKEGIQIALPEINLSEAQLTQLGLDKAPATEGPDGKPVLREALKEKEAECFVTLGLLLINVTMYILSTFQIFRTEDYALTNGIMSVPGEWFRFLTYMFLHRDVMHLVNNMMMLYAIGSVLERQVHRGMYAVIYFVTGIGAGCLSVWYHTRMNLAFDSIGASGAIYGIMGALMAYMLLRRQRYDRGFYGRIAIGLLLLFYTGTVDPHIDHMAHLGGFFCGLIVCGLYCLWNERKKIRKDYSGKRPG